MTTLDDYVNPYDVFIAVLSHRHTSGQQIALTGEMITAYVEMNHMLGRTKGELADALWTECADELVRCFTLYEHGWQTFTTELSRDPTRYPKPGAAVTRAFQDAVDALHGAVERMRREFEAAGKIRWRA